MSSGLFSRRNAVVGWLALTVGRRMFKLRGIETAKKRRRPGKKSLAVLLAGAAGAVMFWKSRSDGHDDGPRPDAGLD